MQTPWDQLLQGKVDPEGPSVRGCSVLVGLRVAVPALGTTETLLRGLSQKYI
jgi:hypothetical protein